MPDPSAPMPPPLPAGYAPISRDQRQIDAGHLRLLSIFHFAAAGVGLLGLAFLPMHYFLMNRLTTDPKFSYAGNAAELFSVLKWVYLIIGTVIVLGMLLNALSGWCLARRKARMFSILVAGLDCLQVPFGTVLGVFTLMVLLRPTVRDTYAGRVPN